MTFYILLSNKKAVRKTIILI